MNKSVNNNYRQRVVPLTAEQSAAAATAKTLERQIVFSILKFEPVYLRARNLICPWDETRQAYREDFSEARYNTLYAAIDAFWMSRALIDGSDSAPTQTPEDEQAPVNIENIKAYIIDWGNGQSTQLEVCRGLIKEIDEERELINELRLEDCLALLDSEVFRTWLKSKIRNACAEKVQQAIDDGSNLQQIMEVVESSMDMVSQVDGVPGFRTAVDLLNDTSLVDGLEIIVGLMRKGTKISLSGSSKAKKTWLVLDMLISVATGTAFLGFNTNSSKVLYINFELLEVDVKKRLEAICSFRGMDRSELSNLHVYNLRGRVSTLKELLPMVVALNRMNGGYDLIVLDPSYKLLTGQDENTTSAISEFCAGLDRIIEKTKAAVLYVGHYSKGNQSAKASIDRLSGSGIFGRDADSIITLTDHKVPECFALEFVLRSFKPMDPFVVQFEYPRMRERKDLDAADLKPASGNSPTILSEEWILSFIPGGDEEPISQKDYFVACAQRDVSEKKAREAIKLLLKDGRAYKWTKPRSTGKPEILYHRQPQPEETGKKANL